MQAVYEANMLYTPVVVLSVLSLTYLRISKNVTREFGPWCSEGIGAQHRKIYSRIFTGRLMIEGE